MNLDILYLCMDIGVANAYSAATDAQVHQLS